MTTFLVLSIGLLVRLALPIIITLVLVYFLRQLDARWKSEAQQEYSQVEKPECWKIEGCSPEQRKVCLAFSSPLPCWQVYRLPNGYLHEECITCKVFIDAPVPTFKIDPRRM